MTLPLGFIDRMKGQINDFEAFERSMSLPMRPSIRINPTKKYTPSNDMEPIPWHPNAFFVKQRPTYVLDPQFHQGVYYPQEASSMCLDLILKYLKKQGLKMDLCLDFCAAPGGKSQIILDHLSPKQILISNEINESRNEILRETLTKWGKPNFIITQSPAANLPKLGEVFDLILLDAPCSGEGMFRKDSFARAQWSEELCTQCETTQAEIIDKAIDSLKNQGFLIYATCTYNPKENLEQIKSALKKYNLESIEIPALEEYHVEKQEKDKAIGYQFYPHKSLGEGFFVAILRKLSSENQEINSRAVAQIKPAFQNILQAKDGYELIQYRDVVSIVSSSVYDALIHIAPFKIKQTGIPVLETTYKTTNLHEYLPFVYAFLDTEIPQIEVNKDQALKILRLESDLILEKQIGENVMSCYHENPLSIMKILPNRINNKYPKNWRIRSA